MKRYCWLLCGMAALGLVSGSWAVDPVLIGNFETPPGGDGRFDGWYEESGLTAARTTQYGATRGIYAVKVQAAGGGWGPRYQCPIFGNAPARLAATQPQSVLVMDVTAFAGDVPGGWAELGLFINGNGLWDAKVWTPVVLDGLPHRMIFPLPQTYKDCVQNASSWVNIGFISNSAASNVTYYIDNVWLMPAPPQDNLLPYNPAVEQTLDPVNQRSVTTLRWKAAADPNQVYAVRPDIVDQYVFLSKGISSDPNLYYLGRTAQDPGLTNPDSEYGPTNLQLNRTYSWAVVNAIQGYEQTFTPGVSALAHVNLNNLVGPVWYFNSISSLPEITAQPVHARAPLNATNVQAFTIGVSSITTPLYQWFSSVDGVIDSGDVAINLPTATTATLTIPSIVTGYQRYYYCRVANVATQSGGGTAPDIYSDVVTLIVERKVAEYLFEGNLNDTSGNGNHGAGFNGAATASGDSVQGSSALLLNGVNQYVTLGTAAFPKASLMDAGGIGGGLDAGSILCWVKATQDGAILSNYNDTATSTGLVLGIESPNNVRMFVRGNAALLSNTTRSVSSLINDGNWHLVAAAWNHSGQMRIYVDDSLVQVSTGTAAFSAWQRGVLIGANRLDDADRTILGQYFGGLIDNLRVYNYAMTPQAIAQEYYDRTGIRTCINPSFTGSNLNVDNTGASFCRVDLADFAALAQSWLAHGFFP